MIKKLDYFHVPFEVVAAQEKHAHASMRLRLQQIRAAIAEAAPEAVIESIDDEMWVTCDDANRERVFEIISGKK